MNCFMCLVYHFHTYNHTAYWLIVSNNASCMHCNEIIQQEQRCHPENYNHHHTNTPAEGAAAENAATTDTPPTLTAPPQPPAHRQPDLAH